MPSSELEIYITGLKERVAEAHKTGGWMSDCDTQLLLALIDSAFGETPEIRSDAEQVIITIELEADTGAFDENGDLDEDVDGVVEEDNSGIYATPKEL